MYVFINSSHLSLIMYKYSRTISPCICMAVHPSHQQPVCALFLYRRPIISPSSAGCMLNDSSPPKSCKPTSQKHCMTHREQPRCLQPKTPLRREQAGRAVPPFSLRRSPGEGPAWWYILAVASCWRRKCPLHTATSKLLPLCERADRLWCSARREAAFLRVFHLACCNRKLVTAILQWYYKTTAVVFLMLLTIWAP